MANVGKCISYMDPMGMYFLKLAASLWMSAVTHDEVTMSVLQVQLEFFGQNLPVVIEVTLYSPG